MPKTHRRIRRWYIEPIGAHTNNVLAQLVEQELTHTAKRTDTGHKVNVWEVNRDQLRQFQETAKGRSGITARIWTALEDDKLSLHREYESQKGLVINIDCGSPQAVKNLLIRMAENKKKEARARQRLH